MGQRSTSRSISDDDALVVGEIHGAHGVRGEVRVEPLTDVATRFHEGAVLDCDGIGPLTIQRMRGDASSRIVLFAGYGSPDPGEAPKGRPPRPPPGEPRPRTK